MDAKADPVSNVAGRLLILPGVGNTRFQFSRFAAHAARLLPGFAVEIRTWGQPLLTLRNLRAYTRNLAVARDLAVELARWRHAHPTSKLYLLGYSGGGGVAALVASGLAPEIAIDRLILVAPAISPDYPMAESVLPHVTKFVASFASKRDIQVGWGTRTFGTIDRRFTASAGAVGFRSTSPKLLELHWSRDDLRYGHHGNHWSYLGRRWQAARLLPALEPATTAAGLRLRWSAGDSTGRPI